MKEWTNDLLPIVDEFQLGNAVRHESDIGPHVFQTAHFKNSIFDEIFNNS